MDSTKKAINKTRQNALQPIDHRQLLRDLGYSTEKPKSTTKILFKPIPMDKLMAFIEKGMDKTARKKLTFSTTRTPSKTRLSTMMKPTTKNSNVRKFCTNKKNDTLLKGVKELTQKDSAKKTNRYTFSSNVSAIIKKSTIPTSNRLTTCNFQSGSSQKPSNQTIPIKTNQIKIEKKVNQVQKESEKKDDDLKTILREVLNRIEKLEVSQCMCSCNQNVNNQLNYTENSFNLPKSKLPVFKNSSASKEEKSSTKNEFEKKLNKNPIEVDNHEPQPGCSNWELQTVFEINEEKQENGLLLKFETPEKEQPESDNNNTKNLLPKKISTSSKEEENLIQLDCSTPICSQFVYEPQTPAVTSADKMKLTMIIDETPMLKSNSPLNSDLISKTPLSTYNEMKNMASFLQTPKETKHFAGVMTPSVKQSSKKYVSRCVQQQLMYLYEN